VAGAAETSSPSGALAGELLLNSLKAKFAESPFCEVACIDRQSCKLRMVPERSGARRLRDRECVAIRTPEVGDLGSSLEGGDALLLRDDRSFVVALEGDAL
jgi:hypothetical protein